MKYLCLIVLLPCLALSGVAVAQEAPLGTDQVSFGQHVRPILSNHCFACHGPDAEHRQADLRLDIAGDIDWDEVVNRISSTDPDTVMPPGETKKPLSTEQTATLKKWVATGSTYEKHWAFEPLAFRGIGRVQEEPLSQLIDDLVGSRLVVKGTKPSAVASNRMLIRRLTFDLTGLPPTLQQVRAFADDSSDAAYQRLVDRLLASPRYGEHVARYWLDLVRFADTNGLHHDHYRNMSSYRDWVIEAFNRNIGFDEFTRFQIAGDLYENPTTRQLVASGFNRLHLIIDRGTALPAESFNRNVVDRVTAVGTAFLGLTVQCAACHDHKFDPISQKDFYQLYAFFNNFDGGPETGGRVGTDFKRGLQQPYINLPNADQSKRLTEFESQLSKLAEEIPRLQNSGVKNTTTTTAKLNLLIANRKQIQHARDAYLLDVPAALVMRERSEPRPAHILVRGEYDQPGDRVQRNTPAFLPPMRAQAKAGTPPSRMDLAEWLVDESNPLTARVTVNRFWQQLFGVGIVKTSEDFGAQGERPSHPELLDALAVRFVESGWDVKALLRAIVMSKTYRQTSRAPAAQYRLDPENRQLARGARFRLDAEMIRDQVLSVSGLLNQSMRGPSVRPPQPPGLWKLVAMPYSYPREFKPDVGDQIYRRSVYTFWKRGLPPPQMTIFDAPTRESCVARRERTNTPLQALLLMNEQQYFAAARHLASKLLARDIEHEERLAVAYETITSREPTPSVTARLNAALAEFRTLYRADSGSLQTLLDGAESVTTDPVELAAWTMTVHALLNLDATKTRE
jgi:hypothetical protein